jgi:hypothetical protein
MYNIQGKYINYNQIETFGNTNSSVNENILSLINTSNLKNPSNDFKLKLSKITTFELTDIVTKNYINDDDLILLIKLLNEQQHEIIINILNQKQLNFIFKTVPNNDNFPQIFFEKISKEQLVQISDKDAITNIIFGFISLTYSTDKVMPNIKYITIPQFNLFIDNDIVNFINNIQSMGSLDILITFVLDDNCAIP